MKLGKEVKVRGGGVIHELQKQRDKGAITGPPLPPTFPFVTGAASSAKPLQPGHYRLCYCDGFKISFSPCLIGLASATRQVFRFGVCLYFSLSVHASSAKPLQRFARSKDEEGAFSLSVHASSAKPLQRLIENWHRLALQPIFQSMPHQPSLCN